MVQLDLRTKVSIDHESYGLKLIEVDGRNVGHIRYNYRGNFEQISPELEDLINSDIVVAVQKEIIRNKP
jgi:hypothetical protein